MQADGDAIDLVFKSNTVRFDFGDAPFICCDLQTYLKGVRAGVWAARIHVPNLPSAVLDLSVLNDPGSREKVLTFVGERADHPPLHDLDQPPKLDIIKLDSASLRQSRNITVFRGADCRATENRCRTIYVADGGAFRMFLGGLGSNAELGELRGMVLVGLDNPPEDSSTEDNRRDELQLTAQSPRFTAFERFLVSEVIPAVEGARPPPTPRYVAGWSNGGAWAMSMALRHPNLFCGALAFSSGGWAPEPSYASRSNSDLDVWTGSGTLNDFNGASRKYADELTKLGVRVHEKYFTGGHAPATWNALFWWSIADMDQTGRRCERPARQVAVTSGR